MILMEAVNSVVSWLSTQGIGFTVYRAWEEAPGFKVTVHQVQPVDTYRAFDVRPTDVADCWDVKEVEVQS